ncbi:MAG: sensor histidine kinase [Rubrivivax sp.]|nr:sensor histidine kinase [Rubrivivax sp.]
MKPNPMLERLDLVHQVWLVGTAASAMAAAAAAAVAQRGLDAPAAPGGLPPAAWPAAAALAGGLLATGAAAWAAARARRAHGALASAARGIAQEQPEAEEVALPLLSESLDLQDSSAALRRAVASLRQRIDSLKAQNDALAARLTHRTLELTSLQDLSIGLAHKGNDVAGLVDEALHALERTMAYSSASVWARGDLDPAQPVALLGYRSTASELAGLALSDLVGLRLSRANLQRYEQIEENGQPIIENRPQQGLLAWLWAMVTDDARTSALYRATRSWMAVPLAVSDSSRHGHHDRVLGVLRVDHTEPEHFGDERARLLTAVASQTALAMRHAHLLARERDNAAAAERNRLARDLHDAVSQTLFAANLLAGTLARDTTLPPAAREQAATLSRLNQGALAEMRMLMFELKPDALATLPLAELLQQAASALAARGGLDVQVHLDPADPPAATRLHLYRLAQEALSNVARHSGAHHVHLGWHSPVAGQGVLSVRDDGHGFDTTAPHPGHYGLAHMHERAALLGGTLRLDSAPGEGTSVAVEVSWDAPARGGTRSSPLQNQETQP